MVFGFALAFILNKPLLTLLWLVCLYTFLREPTLSRVFRIMLTYLGIGLFLVWLPIFLAGGSAQLFSFSSDIVSSTIFDFCFFVCTSGAALTLVMAVLFGLCKSAKRTTDTPAGH